MIDGFKKKLDMLLDITKCHCQIEPCSVNPPCTDPKTGRKCKQGAHITCTCPREERLPKLELLFIHKQREKIGDKGGMQIAAPDVPESKRQNALLARKEVEEESRKVASEKALAEAKELQERTLLELNETLEEVLINNEDLVTNKTSKIMKKRNTVDISGLASTALRYEVSNREAAACATAYLGDLIKAGILPPDAAYLVVDPDKVQRARDSLIGEATFSGHEQLEEKKPNCLLFDSRIDNTRVRYYDE